MISIDAHHAEQLKVSVKHHAGEACTFTTLKLKTANGDDITLFFNSIDEILNFANRIIVETWAEKERVAKESP